MSKKYYKDAFAIDEISYSKRKLEKDFISEPFRLNNYDYYEPKLDNNFYVRYFINVLLFNTDILELKDFLQYNYDYCNNPDQYFSILDHKIIPKIAELIDNAEMNLLGGHFKEIILDDGFFETEGVIKHETYEYSTMRHKVSFGNLQNDFKKRIEVIESFLATYQDKQAVKPLRWIAGPSHLAIVIRELIDQGYIEADKNRGEINCSKLSRDLMQAFFIKDCESPKSIEIYLSNGNGRHNRAKKSFENAGFCIPPVDFT
ncbi:hypothetical protein ACW5R3_01385 [Bizionia sp. KMM 8389]